MLHRYEQVLLTYFRQWQLWAYLAACGLLIVLLDVLPAWMARPMQFVFIALAATGPAAVIADAKRQMADARASLVPDFRTPHVLIPVMLTLGVIVGMPLLTHRALDAPALGLIAGTALASTGFAIIAYFQSWAAVLIACAGCGVLVINQFRAAGEAMLAGQANGLAWAALAVAAAVYVFIFGRLAILHEGMGDYARILGDRSLYTGERPARDTGAPPPQPSLLARLQLAIVDRRLRRMRNVAASGLWRRVRHWMLSGETSGIKWPAAALMALTITAMPLVADDDDPDASSAAMAFMCSLVMPVFCVAGTWMPRRRSIGYESTRPATRERFIREFGLAMAADLAGWWVWLTLAAAVPLLVWAPEVRPEVVLPVVVLGAAEQVLAFGVLAQVLRWRSPQASEGSVMMSLLAVVMPLLIAMNIPIKTGGVTLAIAAGVALLGAALTYDAYLRWCESDLV